MTITEDFKMTIEYAELHAHTFYSPLDGLSSPEEYCKRAKEIGIKSIAVTDHGTVASHRHFQRATTEAGIKPVLGVEAYISATGRGDKRARNKRQDGDSVYNHIILLAKNNKGVEDLNKLSQIAWTEGFYTKPRIDFEVLDEHGDNLIVLSGCMSGLASRNILNGRNQDALEWMLKFKERFNEDFYVEIQTHNPIKLNHKLLSFADMLSIKPVLTGDCHYADPADKWAEEAFLILGTKPTARKDIDMSHANKLDLLDRFDYLYPERKMRFRDIDVFLEKWQNREQSLKKQGIERTDIYESTVDIVDKVEHYEYKTARETLPVRVGVDTDALFRKLCTQGMKKRAFTGNKVYEDRLKEEIDVILDKDLAVYFIILWDALKYCRQQGIAYGAGRGSAAGSLICYLLEITEVDPIEHNLLFWRFLDPERADTADIDVDIQDSRRSEVKRYLEDKYGKDKVASVSTYGFYQGKSSIKAACRILNVPFAVANNIVSTLTQYQSTDPDAAEKNMHEFKTWSQFKSFHEKYPDVYRIAEKISGRLSSYGLHAAGVVISNEPLDTFVGVESRSVPNEDFRQLALSVNKDDAEEIGLIKYDFLGLKNLSVVADCVQYINKNHNRVIDFKKIKEDDELVFRMISDGFTVGIFQSEAAASTKIIKDMGIDNFNDLVASNALVRPGAWKAFGEEYIARKKGYKKVTYPTKASEAFLKDTYGFYLYQEQTMLICTEVAGMSKGDANKVRKLTAKKKSKEELLPFKEAFISGAIKNVTQKQAEKLWADIELTAEYSFNKCLAKDTKVTVRYGEIPEFREEEMTVENLYSLINLVGNTYQFYVKGPASIKGPKVGEDSWHEIKQVHDNGEQPVCRISVSSTEYIDATYTHRHRLSKQWKEAYRIHQGDRIWTEEGKKKVSGRRYAGMVQTYDLELYEEPHAFYANGFLTHNSHSVAYSKLSYVTAWLKYYYPAEFMTALLNNETDSNSMSDYLAECKRLGIEVKTPNVNKSGMRYSTEDNVIYMGLSNIKYISDKLAERLILARPFGSYQELREKIMATGSGLSSRVLDSLNKVGATEFHDHPVDMEACKENFYEYLGVVSFDDGQITSDMFTRVTTIEDFVEKSDAVLVGIVQDIVSKNGWTRVDISDGTKKTGFFVQPDHGIEKKKRYIFATANGSIVDKMDLSEFRTDNPLVRYLKGEFDQKTWLLARKSKKTAKGNLAAAIMYVHNGQIRSCNAYGDAVFSIGQVKPGMPVRISVKSSPKWGETLNAIKEA